MHMKYYIFKYLFIFTRIIVLSLWCLKLHNMQTTLHLHFVVLIFFGTREVILIFLDWKTA